MKTRKLRFVPALRSGAAKVADDTTECNLVCWNRPGYECTSNCAAFAIDEDKLYCLALPIAAAQCLGVFVNMITPDNRTEEEVIDEVARGRT